MKDRNYKIITVLAMILAVTGLSIAYAAYTSTLRISGNVTARASEKSWNVKFDDLDYGKTGSASITQAPTISATQISGFNVNFYAPGDAIEYTWNVSNLGIIDAELTAKSMGTLACAPAASSAATQEEANEFCKDLVFTITYADGSEIKIGDKISKAQGGTYSSDRMKLSVTWSKDSTIELNGDILVNVSESTFVYTQG